MPDVWVETDDAGRMGVGVVDAPDEEGRMADSGRDPGVFGCSGVAAVAALTVAPTVGCGAAE